MTAAIAEEFTRIPMSPFLKATLVRAGDYAGAQSHREVTLEHLLLALAEDPEASVVLKSSNVDLARLTSDVSSYLGRVDDRVEEGGEPAASISADLRRILEAAAAAASQGRRREINGAIVLAAIVGDGKSPSAHMLRAQGLTFEQAIRALQAAAAAAPKPTPPVPTAPRASSNDDAISHERERATMNGAPPEFPRESAPPAVAQPPHAPVITPIPVPAPLELERAEPVQFQPPPAPAPIAAQDASGPVDPMPVDPMAERMGRSRSPAMPPPPPPAAPRPQLQTPPFSRTLPPAQQPAPAQMPPFGGPPQSSATTPPPSSMRPPAVPGPMRGPPPPPPGAWTPGYDDAMARLDARRPQAAAPPAPSAPAPRAGASNPSVQAGQLVENIPRKMRIGIPLIVEARIARAEVKAIAEGLQGSGAVYRHEVTVTKAMSVRLRAPDGGFYIETASPETQWIENVLGLVSNDYASWRWTITARERGKRRLQLVISARTVGADGLTAETALPDQIVNVSVGINFARTAAKWAGWIVAAVAGGVLARFGDTIFDAAKTMLNLPI